MNFAGGASNGLHRPSLGEYAWTSLARYAFRSGWPRRCPGIERAVGEWECSVCRWWWGRWRLYSSSGRAALDHECLYVIRLVLHWLSCVCNFYAISVPSFFLWYPVLRNPDNSPRITHLDCGNTLSWFSEKPEIFILGRISPFGGDCRTTGGFVIICMIVFFVKVDYVYAFLTYAYVYLIVRFY